MKVNFQGNPQLAFILYGFAMVATESRDENNIASFVQLYISLLGVI
jgi:hypothetical protein